MEIINLIFQYVPVDYVLIIGGLIVLGEMLKKFTTLPNYFLTTALPVLGAIVTGVMYVTGADVVVSAEFIKQICIGLLMGWAATGGYEFFKNTFLTSKEEKKVIATKSIEKNEEASNEISKEPKEEVSEEAIEKEQENNEKIGE